MRVFSLVIGALTLLLATLTVRAHHSFAAEFDANKPVTLKGKLTKVALVNPHGWIYLDVTDPDGSVVNWAVETGPANALLGRGLRRTDFIPGTEIIVRGFRAKNNSPTASGTEVTFADGRDFRLGPQDQGDNNRGSGSRQY